MILYFHASDDATEAARLRVSARPISDPPEISGGPWWYIFDLEPFKELMRQLLGVVRAHDPEHFKQLLIDHPILEMEGLSDLLSTRADSAERIEWPRPPIAERASDRRQASSSKLMVPEAELGPVRHEAMAHSQPAAAHPSIMRFVVVFMAVSLAAVCLAIYCPRRIFARL
ncbi:MAG: hypothetical protein ACKV19_13050 [Verrucomicrobiales bacterium]